MKKAALKINVEEFMGKRSGAREHEWETVTYPNNRRCEKCALVEELHTPIGGKRTYSRGGKTVRVIPLKGKLPPCV